MTNQEKQQIKALRESGESYVQISKLTGLSLNSVKSYCRRNNIVAAEVVKTTETVLCQQCGKPIEQHSGRKTKKFCSDKCRMLWWNANQDKVNRRANYEITCAYCGKKFISYGNKNRRYCSHSCYIEDRFGGGC